MFKSRERRRKSRSTILQATFGHPHLDSLRASTTKRVKECPANFSCHRMEKFLGQVAKVNIYESCSIGFYLFVGIYRKELCYSSVCNQRGQRPLSRLPCERFVQIFPALHKNTTWANGNCCVLCSAPTLKASAFFRCTVVVILKKFIYG